jgi:hypothetical protein
MLFSSRLRALIDGLRDGVTAILTSLKGALDELGKWLTEQMSIGSLARRPRPDA